MALIITEEPERIEQIIHSEIDRGFTKVDSIGGYTNEEKTMILSVVEQSEAVYLKKLIQLNEPGSFVVFLNASEIIGRGFTLDKFYVDQK